MSVKKRDRIINKLRRLFPDETWSWSREMNQWSCSSFHVYGESHDYDGSHHTVRYRRSDNYKLLYELGSRREHCG